MRCPLPRYWMCHVVVALLIALVLWPILGLQAGLVGGAAFYAGREFTQWEQGNGPGLPFDWLGLLAPLTICGVLVAAHKLLI